VAFDDDRKEDGIALACSGGGFRATLFHIGTLLRLNELGMLSKIKRFSSVSGGSITCAHLANSWKSLNFSSQGIATNFEEVVAKPLQEFCSHGIDVGVIAKGSVNPFKTAAEYLIEAYRKHLGLGVSLQALPASPRFVFNATNLATGVSFRFSRPYAGDYRIGLLRNPEIDVAIAVAASSAFPPFLSPVVLDLDSSLFEKTEGADLYDKAEYRRKIYLTDGGVYDNMGLETVWNRYSTILVSDAGAPLGFGPEQSDDWLKTSLRVSDIAISQCRALRKRALISDFQQQKRSGTYWGIGTDLTKYICKKNLNPRSNPHVRLALVRTRLDEFSIKDQAELVNWGYLLADAGVRTHLPEHGDKEPPAAYPRPDFPL
jgi:NTE family protein